MADGKMDLKHSGSKPNAKEPEAEEKKKKKATKPVKPPKGKPAKMTKTDIDKEKAKEKDGRGKWRPKFFYRAYTTDWLPIKISEKEGEFLRQGKRVPRSDKKKRSEEEKEKESKYPLKYPGVKRVFEKENVKKPCDIEDSEDEVDGKWPGIWNKKEEKYEDSNTNCKRDPNQLVIKQTSASGAAKKVVTQLSRMERRSSPTATNYGPYSFYLLQRVQRPEDVDRNIPAKDMTRVYLYSGSFVKYEDDENKNFDFESKKVRRYETGKRNQKPLFNYPPTDKDGYTLPEFEHIYLRNGVSVVERINSFTVPFTEFEHIKNAAKLTLLVPSTNFMRRFNHAKDPKTKSAVSAALWKKLKNETIRFKKGNWEEKLKNTKSETVRSRTEKKMIRRQPKAKRPSRPQKRKEPEVEEEGSESDQEIAPAAPLSRIVIRPGESESKTGGQSTLPNTKMQSRVTTLMAQAYQVNLELKKLIKGKANLKRAKTIWTAGQIKKLREVIKNLPK